jgi:ribonuclease T1
MIKNDFVHGFAKHWLRMLLVIALCWTGCQQENNRQRASNQQDTGKGRVEHSGPNSANQKNTSKMPGYVLEVLEHVRQYDEAPNGYVGGREFQNREKRLPKSSVDGTKIKYREWDVNPKVKGQNRGAERLVTGSDGRAWYTKDHYKTFVPVE